MWDIKMAGKIKYISHLVLLFFLTGFIYNNAYSRPLEASFIGNEAFRITDGDYILVTDFPYKSGAYGYMTYAFNFPGTAGNVLSLITHRHDDHFEPFLFTEQEWNILGPQEVTGMLEQNKVIEFTGKVTFGPMIITPKKSPHGNTEHYSYLVEWDGRVLFFVGDTDDFDAFKDLPELDALFITPWFYRKAKLNDSLPATKKIIIYHHKADDIIPDCSGCIIPTQNQVINIK